LLTSTGVHVQRSCTQRHAAKQLRLAASQSCPPRRRLRPRRSIARLLIGGQVTGAPPLLEQFGWGAVREAAPEVVAVGNPQQHLGAQPLQALGLPGDLRPQQAASGRSRLFTGRAVCGRSKGMVSCRCSIVTQLAIRDTAVPMTTKNRTTAPESKCMQHGGAGDKKST